MGLASCLRAAVVFLVVALIAGVLGVSGVAAVATNIAYVLFVVALVLFVVHLVTGRRTIAPCVADDLLKLRPSATASGDRGQGRGFRYVQSACPHPGYRHYAARVVAIEKSIQPQNQDTRSIEKASEDEGRFRGQPAHTPRVILY